MPRTILVGFDDSQPALRALQCAIGEAQPGDHLVVLVVAETPLDLVEPRSRGALVESAEVPPLLPEPPEVTAALAHAREVLERAGLSGDLDWVFGDAAAAIVDVARIRAADLIVVGERHHGLLGRLFGEDAAGGVRRLAGCEVIAVA
jgi:nucleotide-binding universal stress UspA family protein